MERPKFQEYQPYICNECSHTWDKKVHAKKQCPKCGTANVEANGPAYRIDEKGKKTTPHKEVTSVAASRTTTAQATSLIKDDSGRIEITIKIIVK